MKLHLNQKLFKEAIQFTSEHLQLLPIYIEKDYWVTYALFTIFHDNIGKETIFKGGTALSKCYKLINRFSEDIDLIVLRNEGESNNRLTNKIKAISEVVNNVLPEINIEGLTQKMGMNRKTAHAYPKEFKGNYGQVRDVIVLESTWLGYHEPYTNKMINSLIGEMMIDNEQIAIARENNLMPFEVKVLEPVRMVCEKIMSLVRFSYGENPVDDLKKKIRHTYDLHQLLQIREYNDFFNSGALDEMLIKVANDDVVSYRNNNRWLANHPNEALIFKDVDKTWVDLEKTYNGDFKDLVYKDFPKNELILETLKKIKERLSKITWTVEIH